MTNREDTAIPQHKQLHITATNRDSEKTTKHKLQIELTKEKTQRQIRKQIRNHNGRIKFCRCDLRFYVLRFVVVFSELLCSLIRFAICCLCFVIFRSLSDSLFLIPNLISYMLPVWESISFPFRTFKTVSAPRWFQPNRQMEANNYCTRVWGRDRVIFKRYCMIPARSTENCGSTSADDNNNNMTWIMDDEQYKV